MRTRHELLNRVARHALLIGLALGTMGASGGGCCGGGTGGVVPPPSLDEVWCDIVAVPCLQQTRASNGQPNGCEAVPCMTSTGGLCNEEDTTFTPLGTKPTDFASCDPNTCLTKQVASGAMGTAYPQCFDHNGATPQQACQEYCNPSPSLPRGKDALLPINEPPQANIRSKCVGTVSVAVTTSHPAYDTASVPGGQPDYLAGGCVNGVTGALLGDTAGTNRVALGGAGTFTSPGNNVPSQTVPMIGGFFNISARNTTCNPLQTNCQAAVNQIEIDFADFSPSVAGALHPTHGLRFQLDQSFLTSSGTFFPAGGGLPPTFSFELPPGIVFDSIGTVDGDLAGLIATSDQATNGTINLATGEVIFDYDLTETVNGQLVEVNGTATTTHVIDVAPVVTAPATQSVDATTCSVNVTLAPTASSLVNLPVTFAYAVDRGFAGTGPTKTVSLGIGTHTAVMVGTDTLGAEGEARQTITVNDKTTPVFNTTPGAVTAHSCANGNTTISVTVPTAHHLCTQAAAPVTGTVTQYNGVATSIPVVNGTVSVPPGTGTIHWVAQNPNGLTTSFDQTLTVVGPATLFGSRGVAIADQSIVNGSVFAGAGGVATVGNDAAINGNLISLSPVQLRDRTTVTFIDTNAGLTRGNNDHIAGVSTATPVLPAFPTVSQQFTGTQVITVAPDGSRNLAPGQYGAVTVFSRAKLVLSTGTYVFTSLDLEPQATLVTPSAAAQTARIFVRDSVIYRGRTANVSGALAPMFLAYTGTNPITIESVYTGTIIAANASLTLQSLNNTGVYSGEFFARQVTTLSPATTTNSNPFTCH